MKKKDFFVAFSQQLDRTFGSDSRPDCGAFQSKQQFLVVLFLTFQVFLLKKSLRVREVKCENELSEFFFISDIDRKLHKLLAEIIFSSTSKSNKNII